MKKIRTHLRTCVALFPGKYILLKKLFRFTWKNLGSYGQKFTVVSPKTAQQVSVFVLFCFFHKKSFKEINQTDNLYSLHSKHRRPIKNTATKRQNAADRQVIEENVARILSNPYLTYVSKSSTTRMRGNSYG